MGVTRPTVSEKPRLKVNCGWYDSVTGGDPGAVEVQELKAGDMLGRYQLLMPIAKGGMGQVWARARTVRAGSEARRRQNHPRRRRRSRETSKRCSSRRRRSPRTSIIPTSRRRSISASRDGTLYLVMEWVDGEPLDFILRAASQRRRACPSPIAVHLIVAGLEGLARRARGEEREGRAARHRPPRHLAAEPPRHVQRRGQARRLRRGQGDAPDVATDGARTGQREVRVHVARASARPADRRARRRLRDGDRSLSPDDGQHPFKSDTPAATIHNILTADPAYPTALVPSYPRGSSSRDEGARARSRRALTRRRRK